jgi:hypothetical protein
MSANVTAPADYRAWLGDLKARFRQVQLKAAVAVNTELLQQLVGDLPVRTPFTGQIDRQSPGIRR